MSRFLAYTAPGSGHLYPLIPTLEELRRRGHEVVVWAERESLPTLRGLGFEAEAIAPEIEARPDDTWKARTPVGAMRRSVAMFVDRARHEVDDIKRAMKDTPPDVILVDNNCWGAAAAVQASGVPWAQAATFLLPLTTPDAPPFGLGLKPSRSLPARLRDAILAKSALPIFDMALPPINELRREFGLRPVKHVPDLYMLAPLVLSYTAEPLEYPRTHLPPSVRMVGPADWDPSAGESEPDWLARMKRPVVLVTISTVFQDDGKLIQTALDALESEPYDVVVTTASLDPGGFRRPANVHLERFVPHSVVLRRAAAVVCHGGMGITQKSLLNGVPVCIVPFGRDQLEVARRVTEAGAGTRLPVSRLNPARLRQAVRAAIACKPRAERAGARLRAAGGATAAATALEELLNTA
ncbi:glycosyl transferase [Microbispora rosea subsp. aerata]|nr:nucleotide disphospho-sugar-binding domain-containing protein [Microbispora rosea]GGO03301.1 glycosyl transferase [Microbispora rosea subsp. aerata]GIH54781.1 glycosyl transferase [Microbispora rosea subsp. aerata]GLJ83746.1 glycosyl transferase [Microbispora rosea subsp. aerata]